MQTTVTFKNIEPSETLKNYAADKLDRFDKYLDNPAEANVVLSVEKFRHISEISISGDRLIINAKEETNDMYSAIDMALDKLEIQIKRNKEKSRDKRGAKALARARRAESASREDEERIPEIKIKNIEFKPMGVEEAALQMDLINDSFLVFTNARTNRVNVMYRRKDGDYGLIQPNS